MKSDYFSLIVKQSNIPNSGLGVFAKKDLKKGQILVEYRGIIIDAKYSWAQCFMLEDKMLQINEKYSVIGRSLSSRFNDIVKFGLLNQQEDEMIQRGKFPIHNNYHHNVSLEIKHDKPFLIAQEDIKEGTELFFDYSYSYWKSFYDQMKDYKGDDFFKYWDQEKQKPIPEQYKICNSDMLKLQIQNQKVIAKKLIQQGEIITECRGKYYDTQQDDRINLRLGDYYLRLNKLNNLIFSNKANSKEQINSELKQIDSKFFIIANTYIYKGEQIIVQ